MPEAIFKFPENELGISSSSAPASVSVEVFGSVERYDGGLRDWSKMIASDICKGLWSIDELKEEDIRIEVIRANGTVVVNTIDRRANAMKGWN